MGAHHSWNTVFSEDKPLVLRGTISKVELVNPHAWIWIDVTGEDGTIAKWGVEGGPPNGLIRNGITKDSLKIGEELVVHGYGPRDDSSNQVAGVKYEKADGKGNVSEVPAIIVEVVVAGHTDSRVALKTFEIGHDMDLRRDVRFAEGPSQGSWRWRPGRS